MRGWTWTNDNNKHKYKNSDSGNFSMMIKLKECMYVSFMLSHEYCLFQRYDVFRPYITDVP